MSTPCWAVGAAMATHDPERVLDDVGQGAWHCTVRLVYGVLHGLVLPVWRGMRSRPRRAHSRLGGAAVVTGSALGVAVPDQEAETRKVPVSPVEVGGSRHLVPPYGGPTGSAISGPPGKGELSRKGRTEPSTPSRSQSTSGDPSPGIAKPPVASWARCSRSCLMPGIIRCPESTAIQAGNPDHRGRGEEPGVSACSAGPGFGFRVGVVNARTALSSSSRSTFPLRGWSPGGGGCGRMPVGGSVSLRRQATCD
jgi:hypothetical protein